MRTEAGKWDEYHPENNTPCSLDPCSFFSEMIYKVFGNLKKGIDYMNHSLKHLKSWNSSNCWMTLIFITLI